MSLKFEWDAQKAKLDYEKHRVSFDEAMTPIQSQRLTQSTQ
jgi:uncharacterized DUF497 family protein